MIPFHNDFKQLDVRYVTIVEPWNFAHRLLQPKLAYLTQLKYIAAEYRKFIDITHDKEFFVSLSNSLSFRGRFINYVFRGFPNFRNDIDKIFSQYDLYAGSFHATLALAYYLGFKKIYFIGFDAWTIQPARSLRWYELGMDETCEISNLAEESL